MAIASMLDPRFKMKLVEFSFPTIYSNAEKNIEEVKKAHYEMYEEYLEIHWRSEEGIDSFKALEWWNVHKLKYCVLWKMAMDVLAIPISTVTFEATFNDGGRVIDPYRSL